MNIFGNVFDVAFYALPAGGGDGLFHECECGVVPDLHHSDFVMGIALGLTGGRVEAVSPSNPAILENRLLYLRLVYALIQIRLFAGLRSTAWFVGFGKRNRMRGSIFRVPSVSGRGAVRDPQEARGSRQDLPPKGHAEYRITIKAVVFHPSEPVHEIPSSSPP
ncbi:MAG TPA: hypothetical protein VFY40_19755 [Blastocatellia bacterium]|nr:hypothetical protein [Blastocatellia bacterium]